MPANVRRCGWARPPLDRVVFIAVPSPYADLLRIADAATAADQRTMAMRSFAKELDWVPSYEVPGKFGVDTIVGHMIVEHGLENAAAISFLRTQARSTELRPDQLRSLLTVSYNNLIEWHLFISPNDARWVNNLADRTNTSLADRAIQFTPQDFSSTLSYLALIEPTQENSFSRPIKSCDDALIRVISRWKSLLMADYRQVGNRNLSSLFNALIFVRGCEDRIADQGPTRVLIDTLEAQEANQVDVVSIISESLVTVGIENELSEYIDVNALTPFRALDAATAQNLFLDLYLPKDAGYHFNFALMSKHALSRIYEKYVALFEPAESSGDEQQLSFVNPVPKVAVPYKTGAIYTPQFVAGFFARFLRENLTPKSFRELRSIDPACGSGLFLRTLLELQCDPAAPGTLPSTIERAFSRTEGIDRDVNACEATRLSLALLHLIVTGSLPKASELRIIHGDAISARLEGELVEGAYGAVMTNPPYVKLDNLLPADRETYKRYLGERYSGRIDAYIPFVNLCLELSAPGGLICLVLPQVFLSAVNATILRRTISQEFDVRCLVDLSAIPVFDSVGTYTILLIVQRRLTAEEAGRQPAQIAQVTEFVGPALQACLEGKTEANNYFTVFPVQQSFFRSKVWYLIGPDQLRVENRLGQLPRLSSFMQIAQGFVTGADKIFIRRRELIPRGEEKIYIDYLPDRQIRRYSIPKRTAEVVFFPFDGDRPLTADEISKRFPITWRYLQSNEQVLRERRSVKDSKVLWWKPVRSRPRSIILRPKIVCPHLMLTPRFAVNASGNFAVSHSPFIIALNEGEEQALVRFFCAVLNSTVCNWYLRTRAPKYSSGYNRLEVNVLSEVPVPDLGLVDARTLSKITELVDEASRKPDQGIDNDLDEIICELYGFGPTERHEFFGFK